MQFLSYGSLVSKTFEWRCSYFKTKLDLECIQTILRHYILFLKFITIFFQKQSKRNWNANKFQIISNFKKKIVKN